MNGDQFHWISFQASCYSDHEGIMKQVRGDIEP